MKNTRYFPIVYFQISHKCINICNSLRTVHLKTQPFLISLRITTIDPIFYSNEARSVHRSIVWLADQFDFNGRLLYVRVQFARRRTSRKTLKPDNDTFAARFLRSVRNGIATFRPRKVPLIARRKEERTTRKKSNNNRSGDDHILRR